ncbi:uncharacterized protein LOC129869858 [Solanum dulcamara]|uniref:uncharacterized protein LOC129869858 n=1 Tax=Solanum dulcamara TaxID=45834 RepID=UPI00248692F6|nr:uncharacterized protein LOC129869858 [Solanum dulcamara]
MDYLTGECANLWNAILDGPTILMKTSADGKDQVPKDRKEWDVADKIAIQNNAKARKVLTCGIELDEYNRISSFQDAKQIRDTLQTTHEGTTVVKKAKIDNLNRQYELFKIKEEEIIQDICTRFTTILNEIHSLGEYIPTGKAIRKPLSVLPES